MKSTLETIAEIVALLGALRHDGAALFERVEPFDLQDLNLAVEQLLANQERFALVIYDGAEWSREASGPLKITVRRTLNFRLLVTDRAFAVPQAAVFGGDECLGVIALKDLCLPALTTRLFTDADALECVPTHDTLVEIMTDSGLPGRKAAGINFQVRGGLLQADAARHPVR